MDALAEKIRETIEREGPITFETFMDMALYYPGLGYYTSEGTEIGKSGDYYTSPHLHPVFGAMLGRQAEEMWEIMGRPRRFDIVEFGSGRGWLSSDMLRYLRGKEIFESLNYTIVELNPHMKEKQKQLLSEFSGKISWAVPNGPEDIRGCVLSNELLDAFPVHLVEMRDGLKEVYVATEGGAFVETTGPPSTASIADYLGEFSISLPEGYRTEVNLRIKPWLKGVASMLSEGFVVTVDYGYPAHEYYSEERTRGTLLCYHRHKTGEDPYENIGKQDITAHVNFSSLKKWGEELGLKGLGFARQGVFLVSLGIDKAISELYGGSPDYLAEVAKIKGLIMPGGMGDTHKVMVQHKGGGSPALRGFAMKNQLKSL
jgi:SAM-dependent MidA family methyltransferase